MTKDQINVGGRYFMKVSGRVVPVLVTGESIYGGWDVLNESTKRRTRARSAAKFRGEVKPPRCRKCPNCLAVLAAKPDVERQLKNVPFYADAVVDGQYPTCSVHPERARITDEWKTFLKAHPCQGATQ